MDLNKSIMPEKHNITDLRRSRKLPDADLCRAAPYGFGKSIANETVARSRNIRSQFTRGFGLRRESRECSGHAAFVRTRFLNGLLTSRAFESGVTAFGKESHSFRLRHQKSLKSPSMGMALRLLSVGASSGTVCAWLLPWPLPLARMAGANRLAAGAEE